MRLVRYLTAVTLVGALSACDLGVTNETNPDRGRIMKQPKDVESLAASQFQQIISGTLGSIERVQTGMMTASFMNATGLANNGMGPRSGLPRQPIDNNRGNAYKEENFADFRILSFVARNAADVLDRASQPEFDLGGTSAAADLSRLKAVAHFAYGLSIGYLSLVYDSVGIPRPTDGQWDVPVLEGYKEANAFALAQFDSAIAFAAGASDLPAEWITGPSGAAVTKARFVQVVRSNRARMRAGLARTPAERAAVDWTKVIDDATNGIQSDFEIGLSPTKGWDYAWFNTTLHFRDSNWHQMTNYIIGMADVSGGFDAWLKVPRTDREPFLIITPDLRFPQGATRALQNADRGGQSAPTGGKYFRNRNAGSDQAARGWQMSQYDHYRFRALADAGRIGKLPFFTQAENDMLAAEGYIRTDRFADAAALIDKTRVKNGLPALTGVVNDAATPVPGGTNCVPRVPLGPDFTSTACGTILEAMKWEKRMETAYTTYGAWFFDGRGWGDLPVGTALQWPVPYQEADARLMKFYNFGGVGQASASAGSTYGYGNGER